MKKMSSSVKNENTDRSQFGLLATRRFRPFFLTQFFGAFNDNVFKNALIIIITFHAIDSYRINPDIIINIATGLFILPFFLLSATAGQLADKYEKAKLIRTIKIFEIVIMGFAFAAFLFNNITALIIILFFMGMQSTFFGPLKYSILPQHLKPGEIVGGNAMVGMGTFFAILLGTIVGGFLCETHKTFITGLAILLFAVAGWITSRSIPHARPSNPELKVSWNIFSQTLGLIRYAKKDRAIFLSILAVSWFWFLGAAYLTQIPNYTREVLNASGVTVTLLLNVFSVGIGAGSLLCERMSGRKVDLGLVPLGAIGLSVSGIDIFFASSITTGVKLTGIIQFLTLHGSIRIITDILLIGIFGGFYIIPLISFIQVRSGEEYRARIIAANNILNSLLMVIAALCGVLFIGLLDFTIPEFFLLIAVTNIAVSIYIFSVIPEFVLRFLVWVISNTIYRVKYSNLENIPDKGPAVLVSNHVSYVDGLIIGGACRRPVRFVVFEPIYRAPFLNLIFRLGKAIPITGQKQNPRAYRAAFETIKKALEDGELVCIFPEGRLTPDGEVHEFKRGIEKILKDNHVPVIPTALKGLWGSFFSRKDNRAMRRIHRGFRSKVEYTVGEPVDTGSVTAEKLEETVRNLRGNQH
jgi:1-acyl-sn-glycerol-3-phosphate acyltransferase